MAAYGGSMLHPLNALDSHAASPRFDFARNICRREVRRATIPLEYTHAQRPIMLQDWQKRSGEPELFEGYFNLAYLGAGRA